MDNRISWSGWDIVEPIGQGSFGTVYKISRDLFGETEYAALKVITIPQDNRDIEELYNDGYDEESITSTFKSYLKSIVAEYALMRKMNGSANIVNCDDVQYVQHDDGIGWDIFIKMELLTPLVKVLPAEIPEEMVIKLAKDMCSALKLCKKFDIVHRDIKPQNIFLSPNGDFKLGDFGVAKTVEKTTGGTKVGTYKYMAPEVYNNQPYGSAADIYSLGLVLYWMLNYRRMPFVPLPPAKLAAGMDEEARMRRLSGEALPEPANGSAALKRIVLKACAYDPQNRYHSAEDMLRDLEAMALEPEDDRTVGVSFSRRKPAEPVPQEAEVPTPKADTPPQKKPERAVETSDETEYLFASRTPKPKAAQMQAEEDMFLKARQERERRKEFQDQSPESKEDEALFRAAREKREQRKAEQQRAAESRAEREKAATKKSQPVNSNDYSYRVFSADSGIHVDNCCNESDQSSSAAPAQRDNSNKIKSFFFKYYSLFCIYFPIIIIIVYLIFLFFVR